MPKHALSVKCSKRLKVVNSLLLILKSRESLKYSPYKSGEWWFKATINLVTIDDEAGKEKKVRSYYLVMADDMKEALQRLEDSLSYLVIPFVTTSMALSTIVDVFPYEPAESVIPAGFKPMMIMNQNKNSRPIISSRLFSKLIIKLYLKYESIN